MAYAWPGNVRELQNVIQRYLAVGNVDFLETAPSGPAKGKPANDAALLKTAPEISGAFESLQENVDALEKALIEKSLRQCHGNKSKVAKQLKISRKTLARKMERLGLD